jgi:hypothetical protein
MRLLIASAMALVCLQASASAPAAERAGAEAAHHDVVVVDVSPIDSSVDFSPWIDSIDDSHHHHADAFPTFAAAREESTAGHLTHLEAPMLAPRELSGTPMAPLPPAIIAGPLGIALAGWMAYRANRRGGRI